MGERHSATRQILGIQGVNMIFESPCFKELVFSGKRKAARELVHIVMSGRARGRRIRI